MESGGSSVSWSATPLARIVTVHVSLAPKSAVGSSVKLLGPPETVALWAPLDAHVIEYQGSVTSTGSEKLIVMFDARGTFTAPAIGLVAETTGATSSDRGVMLKW